MSTRPVVVKLGGDALSTPERIVAQARRLARRAEAGPLVAVASARRGVTDHLLGLTAAIRDAVGPNRDHDRAGDAEADRAVASGEVVAASLLALALNQLGVRAVSLDAREAGIQSYGGFGGAAIRRVAPTKLARLTGRGIVPVVTGFQGWHRGRVATLGRGGTDTSAVALALAVNADRVVFIKESAGLRTADPKLVSGALPIPAAPHEFLTALAAAGARIIHAEAAARAEQGALPLEFWSLDGTSADSCIGTSGAGDRLRAIATSPVQDGIGRVTALASSQTDILSEADHLRTALGAAGVPVIETQPAAYGFRFLVPENHVVLATRALHAAFVEVPTAQARRAS